jgi:hypothetical protein
MAVWGMGTPKGWRNSATTANQSARAPTMAASAKAASHSQAPCPLWERATTNNMAAPIISPVAIVLFLISSRFLLSTHCLQNNFHTVLRKTKTASSGRSGFPLHELIYGTAEVFLSTPGALFQWEYRMNPIFTSTFRQTY